MNKCEYKDIWVFAQGDHGKLSHTYYELLTQAKKLASELNNGTKVAGVFLGAAGSVPEQELRDSGADLIYIAEHDKLGSYNPEHFTQALSELIERYHPDSVWLPATSVGAEIAASAAGRVRTGLVAHAVNAYLKNGEYVFPVPAFGGKCLSEELVLTHRPAMVTFKAGVFDAAPLAPTDAQVVHFPVDTLDSFDSRIQLVGFVENIQDKVPVDKAEVVVCGGLGACDKEIWPKLEQLADALGASLGHTRPVVDMAYVENEEALIGTSGKSINPKVYLGFGVSGASHHLFGIKNSKLIIAVNTDQRADIFHAADVKVVADCDAILAALLKELTRA